MRKALVLCILAISITLMVNVKAYADDEPTATPTETPTPTPEIDDYYKIPIVQRDSLNISNMMLYYNEVLNAEQQKIARFLLGSYNYMYITARGFSYENTDTFEDYVLKFDELANMIFTADSNYSRWDTTFQVYIASIISYAGNVNSTFDDWIDNKASKVLIPFTSDALDAWTKFYNDPSNEGITNFGAETRDWELGINYSYLFGDYPFVDQEYANYFNNFILNRSPLMFTNVYNDVTQMLVSFQDVPIVDTIYVLRSQQEHGLRYYRFGFYNGTFTNYNMYYEGYEKVNNPNSSWNNKVYRFTYGYGNYNLNVIDNASEVTIQELISEAIYKTPFTASISQYFHNWYYGIQHIVLVDDLYTLTNRQDVYNDYSLGLVSDSMWINKPTNPDIPYWWKPIDFEIEIEKPNGDLDPPEQGELQPSIVNNTVINNYDIIAPGIQINVPVNWFDSEGNYLDYTYQYSLPFFAFVGDLFLTLGELRVFILGGIILLLVGGIIGKFLL